MWWVLYDIRRVFAILFKTLFLYRKVLKTKDISNRAVKVRLFLESLGPTFIKLGQVLSLRPDLIPAAYCKEFEKLFEYLPPCPENHTIKIIEEELGKPIKKIFKSFDKKPFSCASIGQVHLATLFSGQKVAVKVQKPNLRNQVLSDIRVMGFIMRFLRMFRTFKAFDLKEVHNYFSKWMREEMDYSKEAKNTEMFYRQFKGSETLKVPKIHMKYCTANILTTEYIDGIKFCEILTLVKENRMKELTKKGIDLKKVIRNFESDFLKQVLVHGFFQADPHPANIFVLEGNRVGQIDFGIVGYMSRKNRELLSSWLDALAANNAPLSARLFIEMSGVSHEVDTEKFEEDLGKILDEWHGTTIGEKSVAELAYRIVISATNNGIRPPVEIILFIRGLVITVGVTRQIFPDWDIFESIKRFMGQLHTGKVKEFISKNVVNSFSSAFDLFTQVKDASKSVLNNLREGSFEFVHKQDPHKILQEERRTYYTLATFILSALLIISFILVRFDSTPLTFSVNKILLFSLLGLMLLFFFYLLIQAKKTWRK